MCDFRYPHFSATRIDASVFRIDDAGGRSRSEVRVSPCDCCPHRLRRIALAMELRGERPTDLGRVLERRLDIPLIIGESNLSDKAARGLLFNHPIAEAEHGPMANVTEQPAPGFFSSLRPARRCGE